MRWPLPALTRLAIASALPLAAACAPGGSPEPQPLPPVLESRVLVHDSLWKLREGTDTIDLRDSTDIVEEENEPDINLQPGQEDTAFVVPDDASDGGYDPTHSTFADTLALITSATFNAYLMGVAKARSPMPGSIAQSLGAPGGTATLGDAPFLLMAQEQIHVMGVQEVYVNRVRDIQANTVVAEEHSRDHPVLNNPGAGPYRVLRGEPVFIYRYTFPVGGTRRQLRRCEYCPIIYDSNVLECEEGGRQPLETPGMNMSGSDTLTMTRYAHRANCRLKTDNQQTFAFFCAHFAASLSGNATNMGYLGVMLTVQPNVMIAADFNTNPSMGGQITTTWTRALTPPPPPPQHPSPLAVYQKPTGDFTKVNNRSGSVMYRKDPRARHLDDVLWSRNLDSGAPPPSNVLKMATTWGKQINVDTQWFTDYFALSDHFPVIADFVFKKSSP